LKNIGESFKDKNRKAFFHQLYYDYGKDETRTKVASIRVEIPKKANPLVLDDKSPVRHPEVVLDEDGEIKVHLPIGLTDEYTVSKRRKEQSMLRTTLMKDAPNHLCAICGNLLPNELLIAAHIKKRKYSTEEERKKSSIVVQMCKLGCDSLFEDGWIGVVDKRVTRICTEKSTHYLEETIKRLVGRECKHINEVSSKFYDWHFHHHLNKMGSKK
jgi:hypothetical protein